MKNILKQSSIKKLQLMIPLLCIYILVALLRPQPVSAAAQSIRISPIIINLTLSPGKTASHEATIENLSDTPLPLRAEMNNFSVSDEDGGYNFSGSNTHTLLSWITLDQKEYILQPREKKKITIHITTPKSIALGGYYGMLFFEPVQQNTENATMVNSKIGILMLANIGVPDPKAKKADIKEFSHPLVTMDGTLPITLRVKNISLNFFTAKPSVTMTPLLGRQRTSQPKYLEEKIIFPDKVRRWEDNTSINGLNPNIYRTTIAVSTGNGQQEIQTDYIIVLPSIPTIAIIVVTICVIFLISIRKRLKKALHELIR